MRTGAPGCAYPRDACLIDCPESSFEAGDRRDLESREMGASRAQQKHLILSCREPLATATIRVERSHASPVCGFRAHR